MNASKYVFNTDLKRKKEIIVYLNLEFIMNNDFIHCILFLKCHNKTNLNILVSSILNRNYIFNFNYGNIDIR